MKQNQHILYTKMGAKRKLTKSPRVIPIINLDDDKPQSQSYPHHPKTVDLTGSEPELILLDDTVNQLNKTIRNLNASLNDISDVDLEIIDMNKKSNYSQSRRSSIDSEVEILGVNINNKQHRPIISTSNIINSEITIKNSNVKKTNKQTSIDSSPDLTVRINSSGFRSVTNNEKPDTLKRWAPMSPLRIISKKKGKYCNLKKKISNMPSSVRSPGTKPLTGKIKSILVATVLKSLNL